jgi:hypothetical protein
MGFWNAAHKCSLSPVLQVGSAQTLEFASTKLAIFRHTLTRLSWASPIVRSMHTGRPLAPTTAWILLVSPTARTAHLSIAVARDAGPVLVTEAVLAIEGSTLHGIFGSQTT